MIFQGLAAKIQPVLMGEVGVSVVRSYAVVDVYDLYRLTSIVFFTNNRIIVISPNKKKRLSDRVGGGIT